MNITEINTADLPIEEQIPAWEQFNARHMVQLSCHTIERAFQGRQRCVNLPALRGIHIQADSHTIFRNRMQVDGYPNDTVQISTVEGGELYFQGADGALQVGDGATLIFDTDSPYGISFGTRLTMHSILVEKSLVAQYAPTLVSGGPSVVRTGEGVWKAHRTVFAGGEIDAVRLLHELRRPSSAELLFQEAAAVIAKRYADPAFSVPHVAAELHVSERQLARVFAAQGTTVRQEILWHRLGGVAQDLAHPGLSYLRINEVFYRNGFSSPSHAHRRFVERFGHTPGSFRACGPEITESARR